MYGKEKFGSLGDVYDARLLRYANPCRLERGEK